MLDDPAQPHDAATRLRWGVYTILIAIAAGQMTGRILAVNSVGVQRLEKHRIKTRIAEARQELVAKGLTGADFDERLARREAKIRASLALQRPFLSSNDRSRWATVRSLVEQGTFAIDDIIQEPRWDTIDMVQHRGRDGEKHLYSSKPPLLATIVAGEYWVLHRLTGKTLGSHPYELARVMLFTLNVLPCVLMYFLIALIVEDVGTSSFGNVFVVAAATMATLLTSFATVLNNHLPAAVCVTATIWAWVRIHQSSRPRIGDFAVAGFASAFATVCDLPALSLCVLTGAALAWKSPRATLGGFLPSAALVAAAFFLANYAAHDTWKPPYAHRHAEDPEQNWYDFEYVRNGRVVKSYWTAPRGIDRGEPCLGTYALHVLVGHHGIFSLSPIWVLSVAGIGLALRAGRAPANRPSTGWWLAIGTTILTATVLTFYIALRPHEDRNYGGMSNGFRWAFWLIPLWLSVMPSAASVCAKSRLGRQAAGLLLLVSAASVAYATWNPWTHPWLTVWMQHMGWIRFE